MTGSAGTRSFIRPGYSYDLGQMESEPFKSQVFSSETLAAGLTTVDFQQCKVEKMEREIQETLAQQRVQFK